MSPAYRRPVRVVGTLPTGLDQEKKEIGIYCLGTKFRRYIKRLAFMPIRGLMGYSYWVIVYSDLYTMAQRWLPNFEDFFYSLGRLIENSERQLIYI